MLPKTLQKLERQPLPSPHPERTKAPPSTPVSEMPNSEPESNNEHETEREPQSKNPVQRSSEPGTPDSASSSRRRKSRRKDKRLEAFTEKFKPALILENSGSVARDHLASERTFLAYVRTSLLVASTGVALVQLFAVSAASSSASSSTTLKRIQQFGRPLGATLIIFGFVILIQGVRRYFMIQTFLTKGLFPASRFAIIGITITLAIITLVIFAVLVSARN